MRPRRAGLAAAFRAGGFDVTVLTDAAATRDEILRGILELVSGAAPGDVLAVQYSGHGTFVPDLDGDEDDGDVASDEALCPVDFRGTGRLIIDDDLARIWDAIPEGVSLTCFFDSCHSGSANRAPRVDLAPRGDARPRAVRLTREDVAAYRADRGAGTGDGTGAADAFRDAAIAAVKESEIASRPPSRGPRACDARSCSAPAVRPRSRGSRVARATSPATRCRSSPPSSAKHRTARSSAPCSRSSGRTGGRRPSSTATRCSAALALLAPSVCRAAGRVGRARRRAGSRP